MPNLSVIILTRDEEANIRRCLESVKWADEIVLVDSGSTDRTVEIAKEYTTKTYFHQWPGWEQQQEFAVSEVGNEWCLTVDADEVILEELKEEILEAVERNEHDGYHIPRKEYLFGKWFSHWWGYPIRLYKKSHYKCIPKVHAGIGVDGRVGHLSCAILHFGHLTISHFIKNLNAYTEIQAEELFDKHPKGAKPYKLISQPIRAVIGNYILGRGFKDGVHGLILALLLGFYNFVVQAKYYELCYKAKHNIKP